MTTVRLRSVELGSGRPKVCVPLVASSVESLRTRVAELVRADLDLVELRIDFVAGSATNLATVAQAISVTRDGLPDDVPILFTYRTTREGGEQEISDDGYAALLRSAILTGRIDAVDIEMMTPRSHLEALVALARTHDVAVVMSNHEFHTTPTKEEIVARLRAQQDLGADVTKIAVMPSSPRDVITLLDATEEFAAHYAEHPVITMSMGATGLISRLAGEAFGSCLSFGSVGESSAPGQVAAADLRQVLDVIHRSV